MRIRQRGPKVGARVRVRVRVTSCSPRQRVVAPGCMVGLVLRLELGWGGLGSGVTAVVTSPVRVVFAGVHGGVGVEGLPKPGIALPAPQEGRALLVLVPSGTADELVRGGRRAGRSSYPGVRRDGAIWVEG